MLADYSLKKMVFAAVLIALVAVRHACAQTQGANAFVYQNVQAPPEARVSDLFGRLTQDEKAEHADGDAISPRHQSRGWAFPAMGMADAGQGVRGGMAGHTGTGDPVPGGGRHGLDLGPALWWGVSARPSAKKR